MTKTVNKFVKKNNLKGVKNCIKYDSKVKKVFFSINFTYFFFNIRKKR